MSCGNDPATAKEGEEIMPRKRPVLDPAFCGRCREAKSLYIVRNVTFCRPCFETAIRSRIVRILHPPLMPKAQPKAIGRPRTQPGHLLLALSGGAGSTAMLDFLGRNDYIGREGEVRDIRKGEKTAVWNAAWGVYVDFGGVVPGDGGVVERLRAMAEERGVQFLHLRAEEAFDPMLAARLRALGGGEGGEEEGGLALNLAGKDLPLFCASKPGTPLENLKALLAALPAPSRPALLANILHALLTLVAHNLPNIAHLLVGETSTREAQRLISGTASGRGWALPHELAPARVVPPTPGAAGEVVRIKPMKDLSLKEAAFWCHGHGLVTTNQRNWDSAAGARGSRGKDVASLEALTERFIAGLSVTHPATVSTINKTANKLQFMGDAYAPLCPVCQAPVDPSAIEWKARSGLTSLPGRGNPHPVSTTSTSLAPLLCYACLTTFTPLTAAQRDQPAAEPVPLPLYVSGRVAQRMQMSEEEMRAQVADFLL